MHFTNNKLFNNPDVILNYTERDYISATENIKNLISELMIDEIRFIFQCDTGGPNAMCSSKLVGGESNSRYKFNIEPMIAPNSKFINNITLYRWRYEIAFDIYQKIIDDQTEKYTRSQSSLNELLLRIKNPVLEDTTVEVPKKQLVDNNVITTVISSSDNSTITNNTATIPSFFGSNGLSLLPMTGIDTVIERTNNSEPINKLVEKLDKLIEVLIPSESKVKVSDESKTSSKIATGKPWKKSNRVTNTLKVFRRSRIY